MGSQALTNRYPTSAIINSGLNAVFGTGESVNQGATQLSISNLKLKWEVSNQTDIGFEAGFLKDQLSVEMDWYRRFSYDIIADVPIPAFVGSSNNPFVNTAEVLNTGIELGVNWRKSGTFDYNIGANFSTVNNEVIALAKGKNEIFDAIINGEPATRTTVGLPILRGADATAQVKILTSCPSCLQGLSRYSGDAGGVDADYIAVEVAKHILGENWMSDYVAKANQGGIERVLL